MGRNCRCYPLDPRGVPHRGYLVVSYYRGGVRAPRPLDAHMCGGYMLPPGASTRVQRLTPSRRLLALMLRDETLLTRP